MRKYSIPAIVQAFSKGFLKHLQHSHSCENKHNRGLLDCLKLFSEGSSINKAGIGSREGLPCRRGEREEGDVIPGTLDF
jgi:hypothetical protein